MILKTYSPVLVLLFILASAASVQAQTDCAVQTDIPQLECEALIAFFNSTDGANWNDNTGWNQNNSPCGWFGVTCAGGNVTRLDMTDNDLDGTLPTEIGNLTEMLFLRLDFNIPGFGGNLNGAIPSGIGNMTKLDFLDLSNNGLTGSIPSTIVNLVEVQTVELQQNQLSGPIPANMDQMVKVFRLDLAANDLNGSIPPEIGQMPLLTNLDLSNNDFSGPIPADLGQLTGLTFLRLNGNALTNTVPRSVAQVGFDATTCDFTPNHPTLCVPTAYADIGDPICGLSLTTDCATLPVELAVFDALIDGLTVELTWQTASEVNNAGFEVQMRSALDADFRMLDFIQGQGSTTEAQSYTYHTVELDPGRYTFRLKQIDFDGAFEYSPEIEAGVEIPGTHHLSAAYPNPFNPSTTFTLTLAQEQPVRIELFDATGKRVQLLHDGVLSARNRHAFTIDAAHLTSGTYLYRVTGQNFNESKSVMLVK